MVNLQKFKLPMNAIPAHMAQAVQRGVQTGTFPDSVDAPSLFANWADFSDRVIRSPNGCVLVTCTTALPHVSPAMVDWWFGWHLPVAERYKLWHPLAHQNARVKENRQHLQNDRDRYIGNVSHVDEYIGKRLMRLSIAFFSPAEIGLQNIYAEGATAICARTTDRMLAGEGGTLIHLVRPTNSGSEMRSAFWLGQINLKWPLIGPLLKPILNTSDLRKVIVSDHMAVDLLQHCTEEMNHLPRFLPSLYADIHASLVTPTHRGD
jgi:DAPG hydrolase PhiG domain